MYEVTYFIEVALATTQKSQLLWKRHITLH